MNNTQFQKHIRTILSDQALPDPNTLIAQGRAIADDLKLGRSLFCQELGVASEADYKAQCKRDGVIMYHAHVGMGSWPATVEALRHIYRVAQDEGYVIDRAGICLDRRMAVPAEFRAGIPAETGPMLITSEDWREVAQVVPIQPHMGDFMIGFPAATANTVQALRAGVTTIGNLSQYFAHEAPTWNDPVATVAETVRAIAILGQRRDEGLLLHSYLEDGFGALFFDCATVAAWAYLERYIVETLLGARLAHCIGGLTSDPLKRVGWVFALQEIHAGDCLGSMFYGDTISFSRNLARNRGVVGEYLLWDILAQLECPTGHAVHPLPITEALRIPSAQEIAEIHSFGRQVEQAARRMHPWVNFEPARAFARQITTAGKTICERALAGLRDAGVDVANPVQLLYVLKRLGPAQFEALFGLGAWDPVAGRREPLVPTDIFEQSLQTIAQHLPQFSTDKMQEMLGKRRLLLASSDVHAHAIFVLHELLRQAGAEVINLGAEQNPGDVAQAAQARDVEAILVSTHNGMALEYAQRLQAELEQRDLRLPVLMGGVLNQKVSSQALPVDVTAELQQLGIHTSAQLDSGWQRLLPPGASSC
jgi:methylmalonyl-CoA mutase cobalamin-binding subunit